MWLLSQHSPQDCATLHLRTAPQRQELILVKEVAWLGRSLDLRHSQQRDDAHMLIPPAIWCDGVLHKRGYFLLQVALGSFGGGGAAANVSCHGFTCRNLALFVEGEVWVARVSSVPPERRQTGKKVEAC